MLNTLISPKIGLNLIKKQVEKQFEKRFKTSIESYEMLFDNNEKALNFIINGKSYNYDSDIGHIIAKQAEEKLKDTGGELTHIRIIDSPKGWEYLIYYIKNGEKKFTKDLLT